MLHKFSLASIRILAAALTAMLLLTTSPDVQAKQSTAENEQWSEWKPLSSGYIARRRVPAKIDRPVEERRPENVQERLLTVKQLQERLRRDETPSMEGLAREQRRLAKLNARISHLEKRTRKADRSRNKKKAALWFRTGSAGLYSVALEELADKLGTSAQKIQKKAKRGRIELTNAGHPVSWYFDRATNAILFAGEQYETFYTDLNAYRFRLGRSRKSQAMPVVDGAPVASAGDLSPFTDSLTFEEEPDFMYSTWTVASEQDADYWFWDYLYGGYKDLIEVTLHIPNPAPYGTAQLRVTMRGWTDLEAGDDHQVYAELNGQPVGTMITWDGFEEAELTADFDQSLLNADGNNILRLRNSYAQGTHPGQWLNRVDIDYSRLPVAVNDTLWLHSVEGGTQVVTGFTSEDILVIQSPAGSAAMLGDVQVEADADGQWSVSFKAVAGADYLVVDRSAINTPAITVDNTARLAKRSNTAEYLIIAPRVFAGTAEALANYQRNRFDAVKIAWLDDIYNEFSYGRVDPAALGRFIQKTDSWLIPPSYVILVGKGSLDEKNRMGYSDSFLPVLMVSTPWALAASDDRLLDHEGNASFAIGRIPITSDREGIAYVNKLMSHDATRPADDQLQAVLAADNPDDAGDFHLNSELLADQLLASLEFTAVTRLYHPQDDVRSALIQSKTWDTGYVSYDGHGSAGQVGDYRENFINASDAAALQNQTYPVFTALTCAVADDTLPGSRSLAGALVLNPTGGAIASLAPTGLSLDSEAQQLGAAFVDNLFGNTENTMGDALIEAKTETGANISGFMSRIYSIVGDPSIYAR